MQAHPTKLIGAHPAAGQRRRQDPEPRVDIRGRHRTQAELNCLNQEIKVLEEELRRLDNMENASVACKELVVQIANAPDPLLSKSRGPASPGQSLNRWFEQPPQPSNCCWMF